MSQNQVSETCETLLEGGPCGKFAVLAYEAMGGGYFSMCAEHAVSHEWYSLSIDRAKRGEKRVLPAADNKRAIALQARQFSQRHQQIVARRKALGVTYEQVAEAVGVRPSTIRIYESTGFPKGTANRVELYLNEVEVTR